VGFAAGKNALFARVSWLLEALADDRPAIRRFAWKSLNALAAELKLSAQFSAELARFDYTGVPVERAQVKTALRQIWQSHAKAGWPVPNAASGLTTDYQVNTGLLTNLQALGAREDYQIDIGE
jgi:hypothetical protein